MRAQLEQYVNLLFAGAPEAAEVKQEILQNTLDRYDDLIDQGKSPEAAYRLAISGIGDINEILGQPAAPAVPVAPTEPVSKAGKRKNPALAAVLRAIGVALFILCPVPVLAEQDVDGVIGLLIMVACGVVLMILTAFVAGRQEKDAPRTPQEKLRKSLNSLVWTFAAVVYLILSFLTQAWAVTWLIFPMTVAVNSLLEAILDLKEATKNE